MQLFDLTTPTPEDLFYKRNDPNDPRLGEAVSYDSASYEGAKIVILGCPQDEGVRRNQGRVGAGDAPNEIRRYFYRLSVSILDAARLRLFDLGNTRLGETLETTHENQREVVRQVLRDGKNLIILGGGNDCSYPDCSALALEQPNLLAFNIDAHFDVRADQPRNSGTPYRQLLEEGHLKPQNFYEMAFQWFGNSPQYQAYLREKGVMAYPLDALRQAGLLEAFQAILEQNGAEAIFWGFDLDAVRASDAPGVSAPNPLGLTGEEFCSLTKLAGSDRRSRIIEFTEVNPTYDLDGRTCRLTAVAIFNYLLGVSAYV